eukprot:g78763.t1
MKRYLSDQKAFDNVFTSEDNSYKKQALACVQRIGVNKKMRRIRSKDICIEDIFDDDAFLEASEDEEFAPAALAPSSSTSSHAASAPKRAAQSQSQAAQPPPAQPRSAKRPSRGQCKQQQQPQQQGTSRPAPAAKAGANQPDAPKPKHVRSDIEAMRCRNLKRETASDLLLNALLLKTSPGLRALKKRLGMAGPAPQGKKRLKPLAFDEYTRCSQTRIDGRVGKADDALVQLVEHLLADGANPLARDADGNTPMLLAIQYKGGQRLVELLLRHGFHHPEDLRVSISAPGQRGAFLSYLDLSLEIRAIECVQLLLARGALPSTTTDKRGQPLQAKDQLLSVAQVHEFAPLARNSLNQGLWTAFEELDVEQMHACIAHGAAVDHVNARGRTVLSCCVADASSQRHLQIASLLLEAGSDPNRKDPDGTPLAVLLLLRSHPILFYSILFCSVLHYSILQERPRRHSHGCFALAALSPSCQRLSPPSALYIYKQPLISAGVYGKDPDGTPLAVLLLLRSHPLVKDFLLLLLKHGLDLSQYVDSNKTETLAEMAVASSPRADVINIVQAAAAKGKENFSKLDQARKQLSKGKLEQEPEQFSVDFLLKSPESKSNKQGKPHRLPSKPSAVRLKRKPRPNARAVAA